VERHLLRLLARGEKGIASGQGHDLDSVHWAAPVGVCRYFVYSKIMILPTMMLNLLPHPCTLTVSSTQMGPWPGEGAMSAVNIPLIDPSVKYLGVSKLRKLSASSLRETDNTFVIQENDRPLAVLISFEKFLLIQERLMSVLNTIELVTNEADLTGVKAGLAAVTEGRTRSLADIRADIKKRG
jgi:hypothetical protein